MTKKKAERFNFKAIQELNILYLLLKCKFTSILKCMRAEKKLENFYQKDLINLNFVP